MNESRSVTQASVLLSLQRALLDEVFPALRAVTVEWSDAHVTFYAYVDGEIPEEHLESMSLVATYVGADFWEGVTIDHQVVRVDVPERVRDGRLAVFRRREA